MRVVEFGQQNPDVIMLLHGGGLSWWNYREAVQKLAEQYHVVLPVLDGHADSDAPFTTIEDNADRLISFLKANSLYTIQPSLSETTAIESRGYVNAGTQQLHEITLDPLE